MNSGAPPPQISFGGGFGASSAETGGSFNFAASGPAFPQTSFGNTNTWGSANTSENEDPRADTTGEEAARRKKKFDTSAQAVASPFGISQAANPAGQQNNPFNFNGFQPVQTPIFNPGAQQPSNENNPFQFGASQSAQTSQSMNFGSGPALGKPVTNIFGSTQQSSGPSQDKPANNIFVFGQQSAAPAQDKPANNIFGGFGQQSSQPTSSATPAAAPFSFSGNTQSVTPATSDIFGASKMGSTQAPATSTTSLGSSSTSNIFGGLNSAPSSAPPATNGLFGGLSSAATSASPATSSLFGGNQPAQSTGNFFSNTPSAPTSSIQNLFGAKPIETSANASNSLSKSGEANDNPFASLAKPISQPEAQKTPATSGLFAHLNKPVSKPEAHTTTAPTGLFGHLNKPVGHPEIPPAVPSNLFGNLGKAAAPAVNGSLSKASATDATPGMLGSSTTSMFGQQPSSQAPPDTLFGGATSSVSFPIPSVRTKNDANLCVKFSEPTTQAKTSNSSGGPAFFFGSSQAATNGNSFFTPAKTSSTLSSIDQPPPSTVAPLFSQPAPSTPPNFDISRLPSSHNNQSLTLTNGQSNGNVSEAASNDAGYRDMAAASSLTEQSMQHLIPKEFDAAQRKEFYIAFRLRSLNLAISNFFRDSAMSLDPENAIAFYKQQRAAIIADLPGQQRYSARQESGHASPTKPFKSMEASSASQLQLQSHQSTRSPQKSSNQFLTPNSQNKITAQASTAVNPQPVLNGSKTPSLATKALAPSAPSPSPRGKRRAEDELTKDIDEANERELKKASSAATPNGGSNTVNAFRNILESPATNGTSTPTAAKRLKPLPSTTPKPADDTPRVNPFASLKKPDTATTTPSLFATKPSPAVTAPSTFASKPVAAAATNNIFSSNPGMIHPSQSTTASVSKTSTINTAIKPPIFGTGPVDFRAQFAKTAAQAAEDNELTLFKKAEDEEYDSDEETKAEFEARWKTKRAAQLKEAEEVAAAAKTATNPFKFLSTPGSSNSSVFGSVNNSRTSTPGPTTSVLDAFKSGPPPGTPNIFGGLSSQSGGDTDKDDPESDNEEVDADAENKDPTYQPEVSSGPGTIVEKIGAGIASAKKPGLFDKSTTWSGSSTPGGGFFSKPSGGASGSSTPSLFDRISNVDANGNPIRDVPSEEKENKEPTTGTSIFANTSNPFAKSFTSSDAPADQTWKPESPIRFASAPGANPTVSVTSATPTKPAAPNLFGSSTSSKPSQTPAAVGFSFGGAANPGTPSSLFPSTAVSATTSRATSPGGTTDGEGDPDGEVYKQISLSGGGPGEENEDVAHEVRAKAMFYDKDDKDAKNGWVTKGLGPLRILKHKETGSTRVLLRADPGGHIVLNKSILAQDYVSSAKTVKVTFAGEGNQPFETWLFQVKTEEAAAELARSLQANKAT